MKRKVMVRLYQPQASKLEALYGDPRGCFDGLAARRKWYPNQFDEKGNLKMDFYAVVFSMDIADIPEFAAVVDYVKSDLHLPAAEKLFRIFNLEVEHRYEAFGYTGRSMSVGDVLYVDGMYLYCDNIGFVEIHPVKVPRKTSEVSAKRTTNIKAWYTRNFPSDELGAEIAAGITFAHLIECLDDRRDVYELLSVHDSVVRERVFSGLAKVLNCDYAVVYRKWLRG